jgi:hypothetical protein
MPWYGCFYVDTFGPDWKWQLLSRAADLLGFVTLVLGGLTFLRVRAIKSAFLARARLPALQKKLREHSSELSKLIRGFPETKHAISVLLGRCDATLESMMGKCPRPIRAKLRAVQKAVAKRDQGLDELWDIYTNISHVLEAVSNHASDSDWSPPNG